MTRNSIYSRENSAEPSRLQRFLFLRTLCNWFSAPFFFHGLDLKLRKSVVALESTTLFMFFSDVHTLAFAEVLSCLLNVSNLDS